MRRQFDCGTPRQSANFALWIWAEIGILTSCTARPAFVSTRGKRTEAIRNSNSGGCSCRFDCRRLIRPLVSCRMTLPAQLPEIQARAIENNCRRSAPAQGWRGSISCARPSRDLLRFWLRWRCSLHIRLGCFQSRRRQCCWRPEFNHSRKSKLTYALHSASLVRGEKLCTQKPSETTLDDVTHMDRSWALCPGPGAKICVPSAESSPPTSICRSPSDKQKPLSPFCTCSVVFCCCGVS